MWGNLSSNLSHIGTQCFVSAESPVCKRICILQDINLTRHLRVRPIHHHEMNIYLMIVPVFFVSYICVELRTFNQICWFSGAHCSLHLASNWILKRAQANRWIPFLVFCWGVVTTLVHNFGGLVSVRSILGMCEGGLSQESSVLSKQLPCLRSNLLFPRFRI
jgi:hypothetical protein